MPPSNGEFAFDIVEPRASSLMESHRAFGYSTSLAIADLIDNAIAARAKNVWIEFFWDGSKSWVSLLDDGRGMTAEELVNAMRLGSKSPKEHREAEDLGRFGLGLKTASLSQCTLLSVVSKTREEGPAARRWDLAYIGEHDEWRLLRGIERSAADRLKKLESVASGTLVMWDRLDRITGDARTEDQGAHSRFLALIEEISSQLGMIFGRFLVKKRDSLKLWLNGDRVTAWDPFVESHASTQILPTEHLTYEGFEVVIRPFVLPHESKLSKEEHAKSAGPRGWNDHQGFYVYRNERLIVPGDWLSLGFKKEEHYKLARISIDVPSALDEEWQLDVRKSVARPPGPVRTDLRRIARLVRSRASEVYRHRGKVVGRERSRPEVFAWHRILKNDKVSYRINREHPIVQHVLGLEGHSKAAIRAMLRFLEESVPIQEIWINAAESPDGHAPPFSTASESELASVVKELFIALLNRGLSVADAAVRIKSMDAVSEFPEIIDDVAADLHGRA